jgi:hypothetical protein
MAIASPQGEGIMTELLIATCSLAGLAVGLIFPVWAIIATTAVIAVLATTITIAQGFGVSGGIALTTACLVACQLSYLAGRFVSRRYGFPDLSARDEIDGETGEPRQRSIAEQDRDQR